MTSPLFPLLLALAGLQPLPAQQGAAPVSTHDTSQQSMVAAGEGTGRQEAHPFYGEGFYPAWSQMTPEAAAADTAEAARLARERIHAICAVKPGEETWEDVFEAYAYAFDELACVENYSVHLDLAMGRPEMRRRLNRSGHARTDLMAEFIGDAELYEVLQRAAAQPWVQGLSPAKQRYIRYVLADFRDYGAGLHPIAHEQLRNTRNELGYCLARYNRNINTSLTEWHLLIEDPAQLDGMPAVWMEAAAAAAARRGHGGPGKQAWLITQDYSSVSEVLRYCHVEATRKLCYEGLAGIGSAPWDNAPELERIMLLRKSVAQISGYTDYADMICHLNMEAGGERALAFVDDFAQRLQPAFQAEVQLLLDFVSARTGSKVEALNPWDVLYYERLRTLEQHSFDRKAARPYLRSDNVIRGMFATFSALYDITITQLPTACPAGGAPCPEGVVEVWAPEVTAYKVTDNKTGAHLGSFYLDPYARPGIKRDGSWFSPLRLGHPGKDGRPREPHLVAIVCNFTAPTEKGYALLDHEEVEVLFHEFGHTLHVMLGDAEVASQALERTNRDFIELPSSLHANWAYEPEVLRTFAFHHETGEPMPEELLAGIAAQRNNGSATGYMAQLSLAKLDLEMHMHYAEKFAGKQLDEATEEILKPFHRPFTTTQPCPFRRVPHCITGSYGAGYYSYIWGDVLAADLFNRVKANGLTNPQTGAALRNIFYKPGDGVPASQRFRDFMGRDPDPSALMERCAK